MFSVRPITSISSYYHSFQSRQPKTSIYQYPTTQRHYKNMSYRGSYGHPSSWAVPNPNGSLPSASPFSPTGQVRPARNVSEIIPRLYISDLAFAESPALLGSYRITHIMSTLPDSIYCPPSSLLPIQPARIQVRIEDLPFAELAAHLPATTKWISDALNSSPDARVLVHCAEGISRSVSVVAAFLIAQYGYAPMDAVQYIKSKRRIADPNFGFIQQLHEYARDSLGRPIAIPAPASAFNPS